MSKINKYISIFFITIMLISNFSTSFATKTLTKEDLENFFNENKNVASDEDATIAVNDDNILLTSKGNEYTINYNLENEPTFSIDMIITDTMNKNEITEELQKSILLSYGFIPTVHLLGDISIEDAGAYFFNKILSGDIKTDIELNSIEDVKKIINKNTSLYDEYFTLQYKVIEDTETEYRIRATLKVITDKDFPKINEYISNTNSAKNQTKSDKTSKSENVTNSIAKEMDKIPEAGGIDVITILYGVIIITSIGLISFYIYNRKFQK